MMKTPVNLSTFFNQCVLCNSKTNSASRICTACLNDFPWIQKSCDIYALPLPHSSGELICAECQKTPPSFDKVYALFEYKFPIDRIIGHVKYGKKHQFIGHLAQIAIENIDVANNFECIVPIPMHNWSQLKRGFNQADLLADEIARLLNLPIDRQLLRKIKSTRSQMSLPRAERLKNQKGVFTCPPNSIKKILLVDDVMTTGATVEAASRCLKKAGAEEIHVLVIARTER